MRQAEARWENQIRTGKVKNVTPVEAGELLKGGEWVLLDVRPPEEIAKAAIEGAVEVPLFVVDEDRSPAGRQLFEDLLEMYKVQTTFVLTRRRIYVLESLLVE